MKVSIYSCFGRGNWLAVELSQSGMEVNLVDFTPAFRHWAPEDWEGPFGFFQADYISTSQFARLNEEDYSELVDSGFTIHLPDGPMELKGPLSKYLIQKSGLDLSIVDDLKAGKVNFEKVSRKKSFKQTWLAHLACQLANNIYRPNADSTLNSKALPIFGPFYVRRVTRRGYSRGMDWVRERGVNVIEADKIESIESEGRRLDIVRISKAKTPKAQVSDQHVWMLTGEESVFLGLENPKKLYPQGVALPEWAWARVGFKLSAGPYLEILPIKFVFIDDIYLPWTHDNLLVIQRSLSPQEIDCWMRIPNSQRFRREYLEELTQSARKKISTRIPDAHCEISRYPQEHRYDVSSLGPTRFPVFNEQELQNKPPFQWANMTFDSPEQWPRLDWTGQFKFNRQSFDNLKSRFDLWKKNKNSSQEKST